MVKMMTVIMYNKMATESEISIIFPGRPSFGRPMVITECRSGVGVVHTN